MKPPKISRQSPVTSRQSAACCLLPTGYWLLVGIVVALALPAVAQRGEIYQDLVRHIDERSLKETVKHLSDLQSRVVGYRGEREAAKFVRRKFEELGLDKLTVGELGFKGMREQSFEVTVPIDKGAALDIPALNKRYKLYPLYPNLVRTPQTPPEGLKGKLIYGGSGRVSHFNGKDVAGSICLIDFNTGTEWFNAVFLGAKAVIFIEPDLGKEFAADELVRGEAETKFLTTPIDIPRFWMKRSDALELMRLLGYQPTQDRDKAERGFVEACGDLTQTSPDAVLTCRMEWERRKAKNILGVVWGTDPQRKNEFIAISAHYDSMSIVPSLAPGAEQAISIAALLEIAKAIKSKPLDRSVVFVATSGHCLGLRGGAHFVKMWLDTETKLQEKLKKEGKEKEFAKKPHLLALVSLDITSRNKTFGVFYKAHFFDYREDVQWQFSDIGKLCRESAEQVGFTFGFDPESRLVDGINPIKGKNWRTYLPGMLALDAEMAVIAGKTGIGFATVDDARPYVDTPFDTVELVNFENVMAQVPVLACVLYDLLSAPTDVLQLELENNFAVLKGQVIRFHPQKSATSVPDEPVPGAIAAVRHTGIPKKTLMGVRTVIFDKVRKAKLGEKEKESVLGVVVLFLLIVNGLLVCGGWAKRKKQGLAAAIAVAVLLDVGTYLLRSPISNLIRGRAEADEKKEGVFEFVGLPNVKFRGGNTRLEAYKLHPKTGEIIFAPDLGYQGAQAVPIEFGIDVNEKQSAVAVFPCKSMAVFDMIDQRRFTLLQQMYVYDAVTGAEPFNFGYSLPVPQPMTSFYEPCAVVFAPPDTKVKITMGATVLGLLFVLVNCDLDLLDHPERILTSYKREDELGSGFAMKPSIPATPYRVAQDMWILDHYRIERLRRYGVENERMDRMHKQAKLFLDAAEEHLRNRNYSAFITNARAAWGYESKAYPDAQRTAKDVVKGIIFYLALLLPFAFFTERLFFYSRDLRVQIVLTMLIFLAIFFIMRYFHPAFQIITTTPLVILLGFIILALSVIVSSIVMRKFEDQMRQIKFETTGIHTADVGRLSATAAAFLLGISNMRRRKARTILTAITLIFLTFTVLSFTSVVPYTRTNMIEVKVAGTPVKPVYQGVLIRDRTWLPLGEPTTRIVRDEYGSQGLPVAPRAWYFSAMVGDQSFVMVQHNGIPYNAYALVGLSPQELKVMPKVKNAIMPPLGKGGRWFTSDREEACLIPDTMARAFGIREQDIADANAGKRKPVMVEVLGMKLRVIGIINGEVFKEIVDLDGEQLTPVDYMLMSERRREQEAPAPGSQELENYIHLNPGAVLYLPYETVMGVGGNLRSVAIKFGKRWDDPDTAKKDLDTLMDRLELNLFASRGNKVYLCSAIGATAFTGAGSVFIPILIAALIVLSTMLGSVYERIREIGIYTSLGLAPVHIGALFLAESSVYAVLGGIIGYLLGQGLAKLKVIYQSALPPEHALLALNLNYSSMAAVGTTLIVMGVVLLSTLYPAWKASQVSVPGIERRWRLPEPEGDYLRIILPFTVSTAQTLGIVMFLKEYLEAHTDYSLGHFSTDKTQLSSFKTQFGDGYRLEAMVWLAPYDLGVSEYVTIETQPTEDIFVNTIHIIIRRESGDEASWLRVTRNYLNMIRKQFLIWRTFKPELKEHYAQMGRELLGVTEQVKA